VIVCLCHGVSERDIAREARAGCQDFEALQDTLRVATSCGACLDCARETFGAHRAGGRGACHAWPAQTPRDEVAPGRLAADRPG
jgi:bacterioferritin-associated ferredoxin